MTPRRFVVTVSESPARVVVEEVRSRRRVVADGTGAVGDTIDRLLDAPLRGETSGDPAKTAASPQHQ
jgi:hypothetical protein